VRCFIAIDVDPEVLAGVLRTQATLRAAAASADVRWADRAQLHLTLKFLGAVPDDRVPEVSTRLATVAAAAAPIELAAGGVGGFPTLKRPRVLWVGVTAGASALAELAHAVDRAMTGLGFAPEERPFRGHLTIGRVRSPRGGAALAKALEAAGAPLFGSWTVSEVVLYESRLRPTGAVYVPISRHALAG
jgi:RNA 2',3'-cyclic 3'-phosphodiesterase